MVQRPRRVREWTAYLAGGQNGKPKLACPRHIGFASTAPGPSSHARVLYAAVGLASHDDQCADAGASQCRIQVGGGSTVEGVEMRFAEYSGSITAQRGYCGYSGVFPRLQLHQPNRDSELNRVFEHLDLVGKDVIITMCVLLVYDQYNHALSLRMIFSHFFTQTHVTDRHGNLRDTGGAAMSGRNPAILITPFTYRKVKILNGKFEDTVDMRPGCPARRRMAPRALAMEASPVSRARCDQFRMFCTNHSSGRSWPSPCALAF
jgi:hypothetical protein